MPAKAKKANHRPPTATQRAFADLFDNVSKNKTEIWLQMAAIVDDVAKSVPCPRGLSMSDFKGDALTHAMGVALSPHATYDNSRHNAHFYFHKVIKNFMRKVSGRKSVDTFREFDGELSLEDLHRIPPQDAAGLARESCPNNWRSSKLQNPHDRFRAEKWLKVAMRRARKSLQDSGSKGQTAASQIVIVVLEQAKER